VGATAAKELMALRVVGDLCRIGFGCGEMAGKHQNIIHDDNVATSQDVLAQSIHQPAQWDSDSELQEVQQLILGAGVE
jgi:hypothetical protein